MSKYLMTISFLGYACSKSMPLSAENNVISFQWQPGLMGFGLDATNKICHMLTGNKNINGINLASWNCATALTEKIEDIKLFIENYKPHIFAIAEADLHGNNSVQSRRKSFKTEEIFEIFKVAGYSIILPDTWHIHGQARIIVFASDNINVSKRECPESIRDLPTITLEVGRGRERKFLVNFRLPKALF